MRNIHKPVLVLLAAVILSLTCVVGNANTLGKKPAQNGVLPSLSKPNYKITGVKWTNKVCDHIGRLVRVKARVRVAETNGVSIPIRLNLGSVYFLHHPEQPSSPHVYNSGNGVTVQTPRIPPGGDANVTLQLNMLGHNGRPVSKVNFFIDRGPTRMGGLAPGQVSETNESDNGWSVNLDNRYFPRC